MAMRSRRNVESHTDAATAKRNVLAFLVDARRHQSPVTRKSTLGRAAFPGYAFKQPQGAAFAVAKLARELMDEGLMVHTASLNWPDWNGHLFERAFDVTPKGLAWLSSS